MATEYGGYMGKVIYLNLSTGNIKEYPWSDEERRLYLGGKTMAAKIIGDCIAKGTEPLSDDNLLVITTGPFTENTVFTVLHPPVPTKDYLRQIYSAALSENSQRSCR